MSQKTLFKQSPNPSFRSTINQKWKILQPVRKPNQLSNVTKKPSIFKTVRKPNYPKRKKLLAKNQLPKEPEIFQNVAFKNWCCEILPTRKKLYAATTKTSTLQDSGFCFCDFTEAVAFIFLPNVTLSSATAFKLYFCGILLRSKTTKNAT